jgi:hypothetical protein
MEVDYRPIFWLFVLVLLVVSFCWVATRRPPATRRLYGRYFVGWMMSCFLIGAVIGSALALRGEGDPALRGKQRFRTDLFIQGSSLGMFVGIVFGHLSAFRATRRLDPTYESPPANLTLPDVGPRWSERTGAKPPPRTAPSRGDEITDNAGTDPH